ncbi:MAG: gamma carbonic anhydrase family protein [Alphaproteobacteria bacterium]|nr:gamma carbonic anhydrase family protein [Alphaproteobacteria bacterium]
MNAPIILPYRGEYAPEGVSPVISPKAWVAPGAVVVGDVHIGAGTGVWFGCVIRGDVAPVRIGSRTNIQDGTIIHVTRSTGPTTIGSNITIGHAALLHACMLEDDCFVGMRATIMDGAVVESGAMVAAGALVTPGKRIPSGQLWAGNPARYFRDLSPQEKAFIAISAENYYKHIAEYQALNQTAATS